MNVSHPPLPLVTIITPSFNQGQFIAATIESVLAQEYPAIEYLVVDGGSTDATLEVLHSYGDRVSWLSEPDAGQADAINKGVRLTHGEIVTWLNADDLLLPGAVARAVAALQANPQTELVYGAGELIDRDGRVVMVADHVEPFDRDRLLHYNDIILQPAAFFRRAAFLAVGGLDPALHYCLDYDLWLKLAHRQPLRYVPIVLARARIYPEAKSYSGGLRRLEEIEAMVRRFGRQQLPIVFYGEMWRIAWSSGWAALARGDWRLALRCMHSFLVYAVARILRPFELASLRQK